MTASELSVLIGSCIYLTIKKTDWGNVPAWLTAIIALGALGAAVYAGREAWRSNQAQQHTIEMQRRQLELQREQLDMARDQAERQQASKVTFWVPGRDIAERYHEDGRQGTRFTFTNSFRLFNTSDGPVFDLIVFDDVDEGRLLYAHTHLWPTGTKPQTSAMFISKIYPEVACKLHFRDSSGFEWIRNQAGVLTKATAAETAAAGQLLSEWLTRYPERRAETEPAVGEAGS